MIPWRTALTLNTVHLCSLLRYPLGITVSYTVNGVRPISKWYSYCRILPTFRPTSSPYWACSPSRGTQRKLSFDLGSSAQGPHTKNMSFKLTGIKHCPEPWSVLLWFTNSLQRNKSLFVWIQIMDVAIIWFLLSCQTCLFSRYCMVLYKPVLILISSSDANFFID